MRPDGVESILSLCRESGLQVEPADLHLIVAGASGRVIMRVLQHGVIGVYWTAARADNASFVTAAQGLARMGIKVPRVLSYRDEGDGYGTCLIQDLGSRDLLGLKEEPWPIRYAAYCSALQELHKLHGITPDWPLQPPFDAEMYRWEQGYFAEHFLGCHLGMRGSAFTALQCTGNVASYLAQLPRVPVHRDFQSQNIMLHDNEAYLIDFQGMRMGRFEYDLASLVYDPYMALLPHESDELLSAYETITGKKIDMSVFSACALQRLMQALGAFANIGYNQKRAWYLNMIPAGIRALRHVADRTTDESPAYPLAQWLLKHV